MFFNIDLLTEFQWRFEKETFERLHSFGIISRAGETERKREGYLINFRTDNEDYKMNSLSL